MMIPSGRYVQWVDGEPEALYFFPLWGGWKWVPFRRASVIVRVRNRLGYWSPRVVRVWRRPRL